MIFASLLSFWCMLILSLPIRMMILKFKLAAKDIKGERKKDKRRYLDECPTTKFVNIKTKDNGNGI